jgi:hypothetical protein
VTLLKNVTLLNIKFEVGPVRAGALAASRFGSDPDSTKIMRILAAPEFRNQE